MKGHIAAQTVNVEVDSGRGGPDLGTVMSELRTQYEGIVKKNKDQAEQWYLKKVSWGLACWVHQHARNQPLLSLKADYL